MLSTFGIALRTLFRRAEANKTAQAFRWLLAMASASTVVVAATGIGVVYTAEVAVGCVIDGRTAG